MRDQICVLGRYTITTWTKLGSTAWKGTNLLNLDEHVDWKSGDEIVISTTGGIDSHYQSEVFTIKSCNGSHITLNDTLAYEHVSKIAEYGTFIVPLRAEVGLLTRNILIKGDIETKQNAYSSSVNDEYGAHVFIHAHEYGTNAVKVHIENTEFKNVGQAYRIGRHPINFHSNGQMLGSYIRQCSIHNSFNRGINIDNSGFLEIHDNVMYYVKGSGVNLQSGNEIINNITGNLIIRSIESLHLQNEDRAPSAFWISNPQNVFVNNIASGGTHLGFWYIMENDYIQGLTRASNIIPNRLYLTSFENNEAHSNGWYGIWIYPLYEPLAEIYLSKFLSWNNKKGAVFLFHGSLYLNSLYLINNEQNNLDLTNVTNIPLNRLMLRESVIVDTDDDLERVGDIYSPGLVLPAMDGYNFSGITFVRYNDSKPAIAWQHECRTNRHTSSDLTFIDSVHRLRLNTDELSVIQDTDGSLCDEPNSDITHTTNILSTLCKPFTYASSDISFCSSGIRRLLINQNYRIARKTNETLIHSMYKCWGCNCYNAMVENKDHYMLKLSGSTLFANQSYSGVLYAAKVQSISF